MGYAKKSDGQVIAKVDGSIYAMNFHKGKRLLVIGQNNEGLHFIDPLQKKSIRSLKITESTIFDIQSVGNVAYVSCGDGSLVLVDLDSFSIVKSMQIGQGSLRSIAINHEGQNIVLGSSDNHIYDWVDGKLKAYNGHKNSVFKVVFSYNGKFLLSGSRDAHLNFWAVEDGLKLLDSIPAHMFTINDISFRKDFAYFATASKDKTVKIWDFKQRKLLKVIDHARHGGHISSVNKLIWTDYHDFILSASDDRSICMWDLEFID